MSNTQPALVSEPVSNQDQSCYFNSNTPRNDVSCSECFDNSNCSTQNCESVCGLQCSSESMGTTPVGMESGCELYRIVDLYRDIFNRYRNFQNTLNTHQQYVPEMNVDFSVISQLNERGMSRNMFNLMKNMYELNTLHTRSNYADKKRLDDVLENQEKLIQKDQTVIDDLRHLNETNKREIEIEMYKTRKSRNMNKILKYALIAIVFIVLFPLLTKFKVVGKALGIGLWCGGLLLLLGYMFYMLYVKEINRDDLEFNRYNFKKPSDEEVARSRALAAMSEKDKSRCQALAEMEDDFNVGNIDMDVSQYMSPDSARGTCSKFPEN